ncbi:DUF2177 family protein [Aquincola sp. MAHUQ-54]|uniref:DUF2177 family protein n=1 Tax=Aquincola agrisoli TaxID=3119538 RepID=A0AAW9Q7C4_9BURK
MTIRQLAVAYAATAVVFLALDGVWLSTMADRLYRPAIGHLMADGFRMAPAVVFYAIYVVGVLVFAVSPALASGQWTTALGRGALLGLVAYAAYDLTNHATLHDWPLHLTLADLAWGTFVTAAAATAGYAATRWWAGAAPPA